MNDIKKAIKVIHNVREEIVSKIPDDYVIQRDIYDSAIDLAIQALQEKAERDKMRCDNCKHIRFNDNFHWCGCMAGLGGDIKLTDFCSYFEPKESEGNK